MNTSPSTPKRGFQLSLRRLSMSVVVFSVVLGIGMTLSATFNHGLESRLVIVGAFVAAMSVCVAIAYAIKSWRPLALIALLVVLGGGETHRRQFHSCALCRLNRSDYGSIIGYHWSHFEETECSRWYSQAIDPDHEHIWLRSSSMGGFNILGTPVSASDSGRPGGLISFTPGDQLAIYQHIPDTEQATRLFREMRDQEESGDPTRYATIRSRTWILAEWVDSKFARPWEEIDLELRRADDLSKQPIVE